MDDVFPFKNLSFRKAKGNLWATVDGKVFLDGQWEHISFTMSINAWEAATRMPTEKLHLMLRHFCTYPLYNKLVQRQKRKRPRGKSARSRMAWLTAAYLGPPLLGELREYPDDHVVIKKVRARLRKLGLKKASVQEMAAYLVEQDLINAGKQWPGDPPWKRPNNFLKRIASSNLSKTYVARHYWGKFVDSSSGSSYPAQAILNGDALLIVEDRSDGKLLLGF